MTRAEIVAILREELRMMPKYPDPDTDSAVREYDETMYDCLDALRDACQQIVEACDRDL